MALDLRVNFARGILAGAISAISAQVVLNPGHTLPIVVGSFPLTIWDHINFPDPADDPTLEIVTASYAGVANTFNILRAKESTSAVPHNAGNRVGLHYTAQMSLDDLANHVHSASAITSGVFADAQISQSSVIQHQGAIDHGSIFGLGDDDHNLYHTDGRAATWLAANHETTYTHSDIALNTTHRSSDGTDHTFIDQDVTITSSPTFIGATFTGVVDASAGVVLVEDNGTTAPVYTSDGYIGVAKIGTSARIYFAVQGAMYYVEGTLAPISGSPIGLLLALTHA